MTTNRQHWIWVIVEGIGATMSIAGAISMVGGWAWGCILWWKKSFLLGLLSIVLPYLGQLAYGIIFRHKLILLLLVGGALVCVVGWRIGEYGEQRK